MREVVIIAYAGHGLVACDILQKSGRTITAYCDHEEKQNNLFNLPYWGKETEPENLKRLLNYDYFVAIGDNAIRRKIVLQLMQTLPAPTEAIHPTAVISNYARVGKGVMIGVNAIIQPAASVGLGTICNTACIIEHECEIGKFCHIAPSAVLCGNVKVGDGTLIGANAVIKPNIRIGEGVTVQSYSQMSQTMPL
jgi:sugar O-acyltransferase (sialic acid O-acetyltransferase NeuD family)